MSSPRATLVVAASMPALVLTVSLLVVCASCDAGGAGDAATARAAAVWKLDEDANIAYPACPACDAVVDRGAEACPTCGRGVRVDPKTIPCPECDGAKACIRCGPARVCLACRGTQRCAICDGSGRWHGETCPECAGDSACAACGAVESAGSCESCQASRACTNCEGTGSITLR